MYCSFFEMLTAACTNIQSLVKRLKMRRLKVEDIKKSSVLRGRNSELWEFWNLSWYWVAEIKSVYKRSYSFLLWVEISCKWNNIFLYYVEAKRMGARSPHSLGSNNPDLPTCFRLILRHCFFLCTLTNQSLHMAISLKGTTCR